MVNQKYLFYATLVVLISKQTPNSPLQETSLALYYK
jgi:hypothetical protein